MESDKILVGKEEEGEDVCVVLFFGILVLSCLGLKWWECQEKNR